VLHLFDPEDKDISEKTLEQYAEQYKLKGSFLNKVAKVTLKKIQQDEFVSPKF